MLKFLVKINRKSNLRYFVSHIIDTGHFEIITQKIFNQIKISVMKSSIFSLALLGLASSKAISDDPLVQAPSCHPDYSSTYWFWYSESDTWFRLTPKSIPWKEVEVTCQYYDRRATLAKINNSGENNFLKSFASAQPKIWTAGHLYNNNQNWGWYVGNQQFVDMSYSNWASNYPDSDTSKNAVYLGNGYFYNEDENVSLPGFCELRC